MHLRQTVLISAEAGTRRAVERKEPFEDITNEGFSLTLRGVRNTITRTHLGED